MRFVREQKWVGLLIIGAFAGLGCVTVERESQSSVTPVAVPEQIASGQATTLSADGVVKREQDCEPEAEKNRSNPPSVEIGVSKSVAPNSATQPYTRFNCR